MTERREFSKAVKLAAWQRCEGRCEKCTTKLYPARFDYHHVKAHFTTDNRNVPGESIVVTLKDGPFRHLHGDWKFRALSPDSPIAN